MTAVRILGIDPGLRITGWGIVGIEGNHIGYIAHGVIASTSTAPLANRLAELHKGLCDVINIYAPDEAAIEETFVNKNAASALKLGMARGALLLAPALTNLPIGEYSANHVKKAVVGAGHADKEQVALMVNRLLGASAPHVTADAADALAVAICHSHHRAHKFFVTAQLMATF